jgi:hypothetical protein
MRFPADFPELPALLNVSQIVFFRLAQLCLKRKFPEK